MSVLVLQPHGNIPYDIPYSHQHERAETHLTISDPLYLLISADYITSFKPTPSFWDFSHQALL
jgi:hypothetical protein